jgi:S1-C subfamily serine protease
MRHQRFVVTAALALAVTGLRAWGQGGEEKAARPYLGVEVGAGGEGERGAVVRDVTPGSPAAKAGLRAGDRVVRVGDQDVAGVEQFLRAVAAHKPGAKVNLRVARDGREQDLAAVLGERPAATRFPPAGLPDLPGLRRPAFLGVQTRTLSPDLKRQLGVDADAGVVVTEVVANSPAAKAGVKRDDVITAADDRPVRSPADLREAVQQAGPGKDLALQVLRGSEKLSLKATPGEGAFGFFLTPGEKRFPVLDVESMSDPSRRVRELERRVDELEKRLRELEKKPK